eukprot:1936699-Amphidinium_carterae.1
MDAELKSTREERDRCQQREVDYPRQLNIQHEFDRFKNYAVASRSMLRILELRMDAGLGFFPTLCINDASEDTNTTSGHSECQSRAIECQG